MKHINNIPSDITMVGGTMPGLMFYAWFMQELFDILQDISLNSISGTSAGAAIAAMSVVWKHQETPDILIDQFWDDTGIWNIWVFGEKTIQWNLKKVIGEHVSVEELEAAQAQLKTLHMRIKKGLFMKPAEKSQYKETIWFIQNLVKYWFEWKRYGQHEVFDSSKITDETRDTAMELLMGSFQYVPDNSSKEWTLLTDGEMWSWHESSGTATELNRNLPDDSKLLVLTRFPRWHKSNDAVVTQTARFKNKKVIGPSEDLVWNLVSTKPEHMQHNLEVWRETARLYFRSLLAKKK